MKLWVDEVRPAPDKNEYAHMHSVMCAIFAIKLNEKKGCPYELIDIDHDAGDYIKLLDWLKETNRNYPIRIHSMNPVGVANMRAIIERNGWTEVY
jgi:hypothetical protein